MHELLPALTLMTGEAHPCPLSLQVQPQVFTAPSKTGTRTVYGGRQVAVASTNTQRLMSSGGEGTQTSPPVGQAPVAGAAQAFRVAALT
jgi:hypothetical protein